MELIFDDAELVLYKSGELEVLPEINLQWIFLL
jgi:hypothetical protein